MESILDSKYAKPERRLNDPWNELKFFPERENTTACLAPTLKNQNCQNSYTIRKLFQLSPSLTHSKILRDQRELFLCLKKFHIELYANECKMVLWEARWCVFEFRDFICVSDINIEYLGYLIILCKTRVQGQMCKQQLIRKKSNIYIEFKH